MYVSNVRNVCEALPATIKLMLRDGCHDNSRAGQVLVLPAPLMTVTSHPRERVLRSAARDANPFFHMVEAIWMLAGMDNAASLNHYVKDFGSRFAEPNGRLHGAYGRRWRTHFSVDQLRWVIGVLQEDPSSRRAVLTMWDPEIDLGRRDVRDLPCNTQIYLRLRDNRLDMTVCCRSNDMIWGGHGANAVHFSILQEYLAARIDAAMGRMYQLSNNAHVYVDVFSRMTKRMLIGNEFKDNPYGSEVEPEPMFTEPTEIDDDVTEAMHWHDNPDNALPKFSNDWFRMTFVPAVMAHRAYRANDFSRAIKIAGTIRASDWRFACVEWLQRRAK